MKHLLIILGLFLVGITTYGQTTISKDSVLYNSALVGLYEVRALEGQILEVRIFTNIPLGASWKREIEKAVSQEFKKKVDWSTFPFESVTVVTDDSRLNPTHLAGINLEKAGKAYNNAAAASLFFAVIGGGVVLSGEPIIGSVIAVVGGIISFITNIRGNDKLIKSGELLQMQK